MKIAISTLSQSRRAPTGLLSYYAQLARLLPGIDPAARYEFIVGDGNRALFERYAGPVALERVGWSNERRLLRLLSEHLLIGEWARRTGADVLYMAGAGVAPVHLPRRTRLVLGVFGLHQMASGQTKASTQAYRRALFARSIRRADICLMNSNYSLDLLRQQIDVLDEKVRIIHHGHNPDIFHAGVPSTEERAALPAAVAGTSYVLFVSQIYPYKNLDTLTLAFCRFIRRTGAPHRLVINGRFAIDWGEGATYRRRIQQVAADYGLADRLVLVEGLPVRTLRALYALADVYAQPSLAETFGRTTLEAMACGCPVVAARAGATPEILGDAGILFEPLDVDSCAAALERVTSDAALRDGLVSRGLARAQRFTTEDEVRRLAGLFHEVGTGG